LLGKLGCPLFSTLGGLFAGLALVRIVPRRTFFYTDRIEKARDPVGRLCPNAQPMLGPLNIDLDPVRRILREQGIIGPNLFDEATITRATRIGHDDAVIGALF